MRAETGRAVLAATRYRGADAAGPSLSALAARVAATRGLAEPAAPRHPDRPLGTSRGAPVPAGPACALLAVHGGAGVSSLLRAGLDTAGAYDAHRAWPSTGPVVVVARTSIGALHAARDVARQHTGGAWPQVDLIGLVLLADAPNRLPARVAQLADLVCAGFWRVWQLPWLPQWRLAAPTDPLPPHPEVQRLITDLQALTGARSTTD